MKRGPKPIPLAQRMPSKIRPDANTGCWEWTAHKNIWGYGQIRVGEKQMAAHRISYEMHCGPIPLDIFVLHRCDNPGCVNPDHLFLGTHEDNMADRRAKERQAHGTSHPNTKLTETDVRAIRSASGVPQKQLAEQFGVQQAAISKIRLRKTWEKVN